MLQHHNCRNLGRSSMLFVLTIALIDFFALLVMAEPTVIVSTTTGPVRGDILTSVNSVKYAAFKGIRYAKPPLGYLRFKPPIAIDPWTETLNATIDGNCCIQFRKGIVLGSEDCLYINVFTPVTNLAETPRNLKSVMVWIYGGRFTVGSSSSVKYRPDYLIEKGVVYVSFNYRIGAFGFLSLNHKNATGNAGLKDQVLVLKWVQANIEKFGGNPNNVTIFGQSAGSASVGYHILSDASAGLFQGAISMSGVPLNPWAFHTPANALSRAQKLGKLLGQNSTDEETLLRTFYNAAAEDLVKASSKVSVTFLPFAPTLEDKNIATDVFLTTHPFVKYSTQNFTKVPQMLGFTDQETVSFASYAQSFIDIVKESVNTIDNYGLPSDSLTLSNRFLQNNSSTNVLHKFGNTLPRIISITTSLLFVSHIDLTQQLLATKNDGQPIYYYHVSFYTNTSHHNLRSNNTLLGAGHSDDLAYIFYYPNANYSTDPTDPTRRTIDRVSTMWTNFAKYGNPTPRWVHDDSVRVPWPNSGYLGYALNIGTQLTVGLRPIDAFTKLVQITIWPVLRRINRNYNAHSLSLNSMLSKLKNRFFKYWQH